METVIIVIHLLVVIALVAVILLQRSEGGALGMGGGGGGGGLMTARGSANVLTRVTAILAIAFLTTSILLAILAQKSKTNTSDAFLERDSNGEINLLDALKNDSKLPDLPQVPVSE